MRLLASLRLPLRAVRQSLWIALLCGLVLIPAMVTPTGVWADAPGRVVLDFYWTEHCPRCRDARPFIAELEARDDWLVVRSHNLSADPEAGARYVAQAAALGEEARAVPAFLFCGAMRVGYDHPEGAGAELVELLSRCHQRMLEGESDPRLEPALWRDRDTLNLPAIGTVSLDELSLPALTVLIAGMDAFNPCAFFVLLFLMSIVVHTRSRARILLIGGSFVAVSALVYFLFLAAWLGLFMTLGTMDWITRLAGLVAVVIAIVHIKDYFRFRRGISLSIPDTAKPGLFQRMRRLTEHRQFGWVMAGTLALAVVVNLYELACTAGLPMVYTRILTDHALTTVGYYGYLGLYSLVYALPMLVIVGLFAATLGARKLQESEGRTLKLVSGMMLLGLGLLLLAAPGQLSNPGTALASLAIALLLAAWVRLRYPPGG
ncbi:MAG: hypothetical protein ACLFSG_01015 [Halothiobacillaceae bacterium]